VTVTQLPDDAPGYLAGGVGFLRCPLAGAGQLSSQPCQQNSGAGGFEVLMGHSGIFVPPAAVLRCPLSVRHGNTQLCRAARLGHRGVLHDDFLFVTVTKLSDRVLGLFSKGVRSRPGGGGRRRRRCRRTGADGGRGAGGVPGCQGPAQRNPRSWNNHFSRRGGNIATPTNQQLEELPPATHRCTTSRSPGALLVDGGFALNARQADAAKQNTTDGSLDGVRLAGQWVLSL
jgi:hypothetical protein